MYQNIKGLQSLSTWKHFREVYLHFRAAVVFQEGGSTADGSDPTITQPVLGSASTATSLPQDLNSKPDMTDASHTTPQIQPLPQSAHEELPPKQATTDIQPPVEPQPFPEPPVEEPPLPAPVEAPPRPDEAKSTKVEGDQREEVW